MEEFAEEFDLGQLIGEKARNKFPMGRHIIFKCPHTSMNVQHFLAAASDKDDTVYEPVVCQACTRLHFIHRSTGKMLGESKR